MRPTSHLFSRFAQRAACAAGSPGMFLLALLLVGTWLLSGPVFHFSDTWQLIINTGTTIVTFLMVFLIQHSQNRDTQALQLKLDELIRAVHGARNQLIRAEEMDDRELADLKQHYEQIAAATHDKLDDVMEQVARRTGHETAEER
ncbi:hypothetical protein GCM10007860_30650 [Chitiniphilus shinanonensis]|uniref:Low affinity iron permease family protein n=1 Tax=Chitiniphilus shinanonensis TaxID=553088 RepID=A0ABQ6BV84_9NEIS|nr:low affinity iron permease family protein [Chitiniphilus shinanonensis]GLS05903.1 hypothetical protein GCM10007860_30650 [Chitiniphilus shinanonensis]